MNAEQRQSVETRQSTHERSEVTEPRLPCTSDLLREVHEFVAALAPVLKVNDVAERAVQWARETMHADRAALCRGVGRDPIILASSNYSPGELKALLASSGAPFEAKRASGIARLDIPLIVAGKVIGRFVTEFSRSLDYDEQVTIAIAARLSAQSILRIESNEEGLEALSYAEQSQRFLAESGRVLASSLDYKATLEQVARLAIPTYARWCFVDLLEDDGAIRRVVVAHASEEDLEIADYFRYPNGSPPEQEFAVRDALATNRASLVTNVDDHVLRHMASNVVHFASLKALAMQSYMTVPMFTRERAIGALTFTATGYTYDERNLACAQELAHRAALAIENARLYQEAQEAIQLRDDFLSIASHELKTPLSSLQLYVQSLLRLAGNATAIPSERLKVSLQAIFRQCIRQTKLIEELLDVSRLTTGRMVLELEPLDVGAIVQEVVARFEHEFARSGSSVEIRVPQDTVACLDRSRVDQVITNLISNAVKYGAGKPIEVVLEVLDDEFLLRVRDHGIGISAEDRQRIFNRFERAVSGKNYGGFGLGLWISRQIVEAMGGSIAVQSKEGDGALFTVLLPRHPR